MKEDRLKIIEAGLEHLEGIASIYNDAVLETTATFDTEPETLGERRAWFEAHVPRYPVIVALRGGEIGGWAALSPWSPKPAYARSAEISVYVRKDLWGGGIGSKLLAQLIEEGRSRNLLTLMARIAEGNTVSIHMHERAGFRTIGVMKSAGEKFGRILDVTIMQIILDRD